MKEIGRKISTKNWSILNEMRQQKNEGNNIHNKRFRHSAIIHFDVQNTIESQESAYIHHHLFLMSFSIYFVKISIILSSNCVAYGHGNVHDKSRAEWLKINNDEIEKVAITKTNAKEKKKMPEIACLLRWFSHSFVAVGLLFWSHLSIQSQCLFAHTMPGPQRHAIWWNIFDCLSYLIAVDFILFCG